MILEGADWPRFGWTADMRPALADARRRGAAVVLATIVDLEGSAPRPIGAQMIFEGATATGYLSGGCLEADLANHAVDVLNTGTPRVLTYGRGSPWIDIRLTCGGRLDVLIERVAPDDQAVAALLRSAQERAPAIWSSNGVTRMVSPGGHTNKIWDPQAKRVTLPFAPPFRLLVAGADPTALAILHLAQQAGWEVLLLRQDQALGGGVPFIAGKTAAQEAIGTADRWTGIAVATHDDELDYDLLMPALATPAAFVGVLGAGVKVPARLQKLRDAGLSDPQLARLRAPMGLARTGKAPWNIAVAVIAEIMAVLAEAEAQCA